MPSLALESALGDPVAGVDEAGRGPLAGSVYAAAVSVPLVRAKELLAGAWRDVNDSKKLSPARRECLAAVIRETPGCVWGVAAASAREIDELNILNATHLAMRRAVAELKRKMDATAASSLSLLVDGLPVPSLERSTNVVKGDSKSLLIAAASILAKTSRDAECAQLEAAYPGYGFLKHKGYPTKEHLEALAAKGPCAAHRKSFGPVKKTLLAALALLAAHLLPLDAVAEGASPFRVDVGADLRIRQEMMKNIPGFPNAGPDAMTRTARTKYKNHIRFRPRAYLSLAAGDWTVMTRVADEFRLYPTLHTPYRESAYRFPDELYLDNLYLDGKALEWDALAPLGVTAVDVRIGRQDMFEGGHSVFGLDRLMTDGTPADGSRSAFSDMVRVRLHFGESRALDAFALFDHGRNDASFGTHLSRGRSLNLITPSDGSELDEWGGGLVYSQKTESVPFKVYALFKETQGRTSVPRRAVTTAGFLLSPTLTDAVSADLELAKQAVGDRLGGEMAFVALRYAYAPATLSWETTYDAGDGDHLPGSEDDRSWDPMWARSPQQSEMLVNGGFYANGWWSNMIFSKAAVAFALPRRQRVTLSSGPIFAAEQDRLGRADGRGSTFKGVLSAARYDFTLRSAPENATGLDRVEILGHLVGELFNPGGYYETSRPAYFLRWQLEFRF